jgi:hypothetical protein
MALQTINIGVSPNDGSGDPLRTAMDKVNDNFALLDTVFNVKSYGAVGDGVTDDTAAVTAAWNAAKLASRPVLYFPRGTYKVATSSGNPYFNLVENMTIKGDGKYASIVHWVDTNSGSTISLIGDPVSGS